MVECGLLYFVEEVPAFISPVDIISVPGGGVLDSMHTAHIHIYSLQPLPLLMEMAKQDNSHSHHSTGLKPACNTSFYDEPSPVLNSWHSAF